MNKLFMWILMFSLIFINGCGEDETPVGPSSEPELVGCEVADVYDWDSVEFSSTLDGGQDTWIAFSLGEITLFSVFLDKTGFQCSIFNGCDGPIGDGVYSVDPSGTWPPSRGEYKMKDEMSRNKLIVLEEKIEDLEEEIEKLEQELKDK